MMGLADLNREYGAYIFPAQSSDRGFLLRKLVILASHAVLRSYVHNAPIDAIHIPCIIRLRPSVYRE